MTDFGNLVWAIFTGVIFVGLFAAMWRSAGEELRKESEE